MAPADDRPDHWQARLDLLQARGRLPSVAAGVLRGGRLVWSGAAGAATEPDVQYRIGSITKTMAAVTVLQCRDDGLLTLDDPVGRFVPETGYADTTVRALLAHTSGMQSEPVGPWWERSPGVDFPALARANDGSCAVAAAGEFFHYSNLGFALLGEVVARLRGGAWWEVLRERVLAPLGMDRTTYHPTLPAAQGYSVDHFAGTLTEEPHHDTAAMAPAGQLWSTVEDLARWAVFLAAGDRDVLVVETLREAAEPQPPASDHGLGLRVLQVDGRSLVGHTGTMPGFVASLFVDPENGDGTVLLANATTGLDSTGVPHALLAGDLIDSITPWVPTQRVPAEAAELLGLWFWGNSAVEVRWHNERLQLHSLAMGTHTDTFELREGRFLGTDGYHRGETLHVARRADGAVGHLDCATFVYTRTPYDPDVPIPGGRPDRRSSGRVPHTDH